MLARLRRRRNDFLMQIIGHADRHRLNIVAGEQVAVVLVSVGDAARVGELAGFAGRPGRDRNNFSIRHMLQAIDVNIGDEPAADHADTYFVHDGVLSAEPPRV
ncbi:MAG: hypothetical protein U0521_10835 [Anaerolineae bacterium]